jgi:hypothetical protein
MLDRQVEAQRGWVSSSRRRILWDKLPGLAVLYPARYSGELWSRYVACGSFLLRVE